ncbi:UNVERIFIED_ORG: hypothetical protein ABIB63_001951 [Xanthomonas axonopodis]
MIVLTHSLFFLNELIKVGEKADPAQLQARHQEAVLGNQTNEDRRSQE